MQAITKYRAIDGSEWARAADAERRDAECKRINAALGSFRRTEGIPHGYWVQRSREELFGVRRRLWTLIVERYGKSYPEWTRWDAHQVHPMSGVGRVLSDEGGPLGKAWSMLASFNFDNYREYDQPYFAMNPDRAEGEFIKG